MYSKLIWCLLLFTLATSTVAAEPLKVMIQNRQKQLDISFLENYALVANDINFYGPISHKTDLRVELLKNGQVKVSAVVISGKKKIYKPLVSTAGPIHIVRGFNARADFKKSQLATDFNKRLMQKNALNLAKESYKTSEFFKIKNPKMGGDITYSGPLSIHVREPKRDSFYLVETVDSEVYLSQVVNCELSSSKNLEALKAQSVMSRTFALYTKHHRAELTRTKRENWGTYDLLASSSDQAYNCKLRVNNQHLPSPLVKRAVKETQGIVLLKKGELIQTQYCAHCGKCPYCKANEKNTTPKGAGACQNAVKYYGEKGHNYKFILKKFYANSYADRYSNKNTQQQAGKQLKKNLQASDRSSSKKKAVSKKTKSS